MGDALGGLGGATPTVLSERITLANTQAAGGSAPGMLQNATGDLKNARPDPQSGLGESNSNRRNGTQMDKMELSSVMTELRQIARELKWLRDAADRAYPLNEEQKAYRQKEIEGLRRAGRA